MDDKWSEFMGFPSCRPDIWEELRQGEAKLRRLAFYDNLTGLPNRTYLLHLLEEMAASCQGAVISIDLNNFQTVNDSMGEDCGDLLLQQVAGRLRESLDESCVLARTSSDEFVAVCPAMTPERLNISGWVGNMAEMFRDPFVVKEQSCHLSASFGVAMYPKHGTSATQVMQHANVALYEVKKRGKKGWVLFEPSMKQRLQRKTTLEQNLYQALKNEEFFLEYQPVVDPRTREVIQLEALVRWHRLKEGIISPGDFIPLAEENGLIEAIGLWVLEEACAYAVELRKATGRNLRMAVNVSAKQIEQAGFVCQVLDVLERTGLPPSALELEITESLLIASFDKAVKVLHELGDAGVRFSLDDFGTGYSSLTYLTKLPIHTVKLDKTFIQDIQNDPVFEAVVRSVIEMSHHLSLRVVAEGVESREQFRHLCKLNCDYLQGYWFSPPLPQGKIRRFLDLWTAQRLCHLWFVEESPGSS